MKCGIPPEKIWFFATGMITDTTQSKLASPKNTPRMRLASVPTYFDVFVRAFRLAIIKQLHKTSILQGLGS